jgi:hypothetical protein
MVLLTKSLHPLWVEKYQTGNINMKTKKTSTFVPNVSNKLPDTKSILYDFENFSNKETLYPDTLNILNKKFIIPSNMKSHMNPLWVLVIFLIFIWIILLILNKNLF